MAGIAYYTIAGRQVGGHYVRPGPPKARHSHSSFAALTFNCSSPWAGWPPWSVASSTLPPAPRSPLVRPPPLLSTPPAPTRPTLSSARIPQSLSSFGAMANPTIGSSSSSRTRRTKWWIRETLVDAFVRTGVHISHWKTLHLRSLKPGRCDTIDTSPTHSCLPTTNCCVPCRNCFHKVTE